MMLPTSTHGPCADIMSSRDEYLDNSTWGFTSILLSYYINLCDAPSSHGSTVEGRDHVKWTMKQHNSLGMSYALKWRPLKPHSDQLEAPRDAVNPEPGGSNERSC
jgi:hypothetical protein